MGEIRIYIPSETLGFPYMVCQKIISIPNENFGVPYPVGKKVWYHCIIWHKKACLKIKYRQFWLVNPAICAIFHRIIGNYLFREIIGVCFLSSVLTK